MSSQKFFRKENFIHRYPAYLWAGGGVLLSSFVGRELFDVAANLGSSPLPLLNFSAGQALPATLTMLVAAKIATFFLLWGWVTRFEQAQQKTGGVFSAFLFALHPLMTANSGRMGLFIGVLAFFWWGWVASSSSLKAFPTWIFPLCIILTGSILLSPWFFVLLALVPLFLRSPFRGMRFSSTQRLRFRVFLAIVVLVTLYLFCSPTDVRNLLENHSVLWVENIQYFFLSLSSLYVWGAFIFFCFGFGLVLWRHPASILLIVGLTFGVLSITRFDLGGILLLWTVLCVLAGIAVELSWKPLIASGFQILPNLLLVLLLAAALHFGHRDYIHNLLLAQKQYRSSFASECGEWTQPPTFAQDEMFLTIAEHADHANGCYLAFGNYHNVLPGRYEAAFYLCYSAMSNSETIVDVTQRKGTQVLATESVPVSDSSTNCISFPSAVLTYTILKNPRSSVEHRLYYGGQGQLYFHHVDIKAIP